MAGGGAKPKKNTPKDDEASTPTSRQPDAQAGASSEKTIQSGEFAIILTKITEMSEKLGALLYIKERVEEITTNYAFLSVKYEDQKKELLGLQNENKEMRNETSVIMNSLSEVQKENRELKKKIDEMEQYSRNANVEILGVPETPSEMVETIVGVIGQKLQVNIVKTDIEVAHRIPTNSTQYPKPIVVKFKDRKVRDLVIEKARKTKLKAKDLLDTFPETAVFVNEHLTAERKKLMASARVKKTEMNYKYLWTRSGQIYIKKTDTSHPIKIMCTEDLCKIV